MLSPEPLKLPEYVGTTSFLARFSETIGRRLLVHGDTDEFSNRTLYQRDPRVFAVWSQAGNNAGKVMQKLVRSVLNMNGEDESVFRYSFDRGQLFVSEDAAEMLTQMVQVKSLRAIILDKTEALFGNEVTAKKVALQLRSLLEKTSPNTIMICCFEHTLPQQNNPVVNEFRKQFDYDLWFPAPEADHLKLVYRTWFMEYARFHGSDVVQIKLTDDDYEDLAANHSYCCTQHDVLLFLQDHVAMPRLEEVTMEYLVRECMTPGADQREYPSVLPYGSARDMENEMALCVGKSVPAKLVSHKRQKASSSDVPCEQDVVVAGPVVPLENQQQDLLLEEMKK